MAECCYCKNHISMSEGTPLSLSADREIRVMSMGERNGRCRWITLKKGFTLLELLVVVAIIAVLIAFLLPSLQKARASANDVKCRANILSLCQANEMYLNENNGTVFDLRPDCIAPLARYYQFASILDCPSCKEPYIIPSSWPSSQAVGMRCSIGFNYFIFSRDSYYYADVGAHNIGQFEEPNKTFLFGDGASDTGTGTFGELWIRYSYYNIPFWNRLDARHNGRCNIGYADAHVGPAPDGPGAYDWPNSNSKVFWAGWTKW